MRVAYKKQGFMTTVEVINRIAQMGAWLDRHGEAHPFYEGVRHYRERLKRLIT